MIVNSGKTLHLLFRNLIITVLVFLLISRSWTGEDAFIFFRYVDNLLSGHGLVFNLGEKVEGFTSPLWVFLLAVLKFLTLMELRPLVILTGLVLSTTTVFFSFIKDTKDERFFPLILVLLFSTSVFRDFATSGFETSLTYLLLIFILIHIKYLGIDEKPLRLGILTSLLVLNRPESFLIYVYIFTVLVLAVIKSSKDRSTRLLNLFLSLIPFLVLVGGYQIFRINYFGAWLPNTFYAKKGGEFYFSQGWNYFLDLVLSYPFLFSVLLLTYIGAILNRFKKYYEDTLFEKRTHLTLIAFLLLSYVLYSGGDYMHGRSLLMFMITISFAVSDVPSKIISYLVEKRELKSEETQTLCTSLRFILLISIFINTKQLPLTVRAGKQINNINDERTHFGYNFKLLDFWPYINQTITDEFGWKYRGYYYRDIAAAVDMPISVVNPNIGYFGYAAGPQVSVKGAVLIDPYIARLPVEQRGKIGHENDSCWDYVWSQKPTFSYTPYKQWNSSAQFRYEKSQYSGWIKDDSDDSFVPIFDLSNDEFLKRFSELVGENVKEKIDKAQLSYLENSELNCDYLGFLRLYWYPYANEEGGAKYDEKYAKCRKEVE